MAIVEWLKNNKLTTLLVLVILYLLFKNSSSGYQSLNMPMVDIAPSTTMMSKGVALPGSAGNYYGEAAPTPEVKNRLVVSDSNFDK